MNDIHRIKTLLSADAKRALEKIASGTEAGKWFSLKQDEDCFYFIYNKMTGFGLFLKNGLSQLNECIKEPLKNYGLTETEIAAYNNLLMSV